MEDIKLTAKKLQKLLVDAAYGRAMIAANMLESRLATFLVCHAVEHSYPIEQETIRRMTLGALVNKFVDKYQPSEQIREELDNMVFFRNELAHRISNTFLQAATDKHWRERVLEELLEIEGYFHATDKLLCPYLERCYQITKTSEADLLRIAEKIYPGFKVRG